jgi:N-acetylglutamate synthase
MMIVDTTELEVLTLRAWPAVEVARLGDWRLAASAGHGMRVNCIWPLGEVGLPLGVAIAQAEAWYRRRGLATRFKLVDRATPAGLDEALAERGYRVVAETLVMTGPAAGEADGRIHLSSKPDASFEAVFVGAGGQADEAAERLATLARMPPPAIFAGLQVDGAPAAIGACAIEGAWAGLFGMRTLATHRRQGLARRLASGLLAAARRAGAAQAYLQVEASNGPAIALYRGLGFETAYAYRYRVRA